MTKRLFFFVFSLIATVAMQAQSLNGTWVSKMNDDEGTAIDLYFIFNKPNLTMKAVVVVNDNDAGEFTVSFQFPGTYTQADKKLTIKGGGKLTAYSNDTNPYGAGIGGGYGYGKSCGNIEIQGGDITATGGGSAAGIGSGQGGICGTITISGGTVTATGGDLAAGIGSGYGNNTSCVAITITGGTVTATGDYGAAGIGSGYYASCGAITITTDVTQVTATKGGESAPNSIGAGVGGSCGTVTIGGVVYYENNAYVGTGSTYLTQDQIVYPQP